MEIRFATQNDAQTVSGMLKALGDEMAERAGAVVNTDRDSIEKLFGENLDTKFHALILEDGGRAIGFATFYESFALYAGGSYMTVTELFIESASRSKGYGAQALEWLREYGKRAGYSRIELTTPPVPEFQRSLDFYLQNGFEVTGGRKVKYDLL